jgi:putative flippase GtrA
MILQNPQERARFMRFALVGIAGAMIDFGTFNLLTHTTLIPIIWCSVISFIAAVFNNFFWNRFWTYPESRSKAVSKQLWQFGLISFIGLGIRTPLFAGLERILIRSLSTLLPKSFSFGSTFIGHNLALAVAVLVVMMWNFYANRFWTYNDIA